MADLGTHGLQRRHFLVEAALQAALAGGHGVQAEVHLTHGDGGRRVAVGQGEVVDTVARQGQFQEGAGEAGALLHQREQAARGHVQAAEGAAQQADGLAHEPVLPVGHQHGIQGQHGGGIAFGLDEPGADVQFIGAHGEDGIVQLTRQGQGVPRGARSLDAGDVRWLGTRRRLDREGGRALGAVDGHDHVRVDQAVGLDAALDRGQLDALGVSRAVTARRQGQGALAHLLGEDGRLGNVVHQAPVLGPLATHAFHAGAEQVGQVMAHLALVGHAGEATGAGQHAQQRHLGQADGAGAVIHEQDLVAGQGHFVAATGAGAVHGGQELQPAVLRGVFQAVAGFVGELAEVHFPGVAGDAQHEDVGAGAEHLVLGAGQHHRAHFRVLEADAVDGVVQFDVHAQVVAVELELVAGAQAAVIVKVRLQRGHRAFEAQLPVLVLRGVGLVVDAGGGAHAGLQGVQAADEVECVRYSPR